MNTNRLRIGLLGLASAVAGFALQGCFAQQPLPECSVTVTAAGLGLTPYYVLLTKVDSTGAGTCGDFTHMYAGMQRYRTQASGGSFTLGVKTSLIADPYLGYVYSADVDPTNNCVRKTDCLGRTLITNRCVVSLDDGGIETVLGEQVVKVPLADGGAVGNIILADGGLGLLRDGGVARLPLTNECESVDDEYPRVDATDPDGKKITALGKMPQFPTNGVCTVTDFEGGVQNFQAEQIELVDGSMTSMDAVTYKVEFTDFNVINSTKVPGTAFTSKVKFTEGSCVANYTAVGFWPEIHCEADADCDPNADLDAGRISGSGINPEFKPKCDTDLGVCVPTADVTKIK
ncbi:MAG: hypothetical protein ACOZQL_27770 [Myxococcota bacterium]